MGWCLIEIDGGALLPESTAPGAETRSDKCDVTRDLD
jgi:hypothetical protein